MLTVLIFHFLGVMKIDRKQKKPDLVLSTSKEFGPCGGITALHGIRDGEWATTLLATTQLKSKRCEYLSSLGG